MARIHTNNMARQIVFRTSRRVETILLIDKWDMKIVQVRKLIAKIFVYSAMKIRANIPALNSILKPDTSSDSPSARSKGVRLVSARLVINHKMEIGKITSIRGVIWSYAIRVKSNLEINIKAEIKIRDILTS